MNWLCCTGETIKEEEAVDSQEKLESIGRKRKFKDIAECSKVDNCGKKKKLP